MTTTIYWHWLAFGAVLFALEIVLPGAIIMWFGFGAVVTGIVMWFVPSLPLAGQIILFVVLAVISLLIWRKTPWYKVETTPSDTAGLNNRINNHLGKVYTLSQAIHNGRGMVEVDGSFWQVQGADMPVGTRVRVTHVEGNFFKVESAN